MNNTIRGKAFVLGDNIDTDQIIPAKYLAYNPSDPAERKYFGMYATWTACPKDANPACPTAMSPSC